MQLSDERDPGIAVVEEEVDTSLLDNSDDPWLGGNDDIVSDGAPGVVKRRDESQEAEFDEIGTRESRKEMRAYSKEKGAFMGSCLVGDPEALRRRWESVQVGFVDDPRRAVEDAEQLVATAVEELVDNFRLERQRLEAAWSEDSDRSLNDLRLAFQRYRDFFERLLQV